MRQSWQFVAFPLVVDWQPDFASLAVYFPGVECGWLRQAPVSCRWRSRFGPPRYRDLPALLRGFRPGELSQWQAFLDFLAAQEQEEENALRAAIRGRFAAVLPPSPDPEFLWSLACQLEEMLQETAAGLAKLRRQEEALSAALGGDLEEAIALGALEPSFSPDLGLSPPDPELARVRLLFWRQLLEVEAATDRVGLVLANLAGDTSPRLLYAEAQASGEPVQRWSWQLPKLDPAAPEVAPWQEKFQAALAEMLNAALAGMPGAAAALTALLTELPAAAAVGGLTLELWSRAPDRSPLPSLLLVAAPAASPAV